MVVFKSAAALSEASEEAVRPAWLGSFKAPQRRGLAGVGSAPLTRVDTCECSASGPLLASPKSDSFASMWEVRRMLDVLKSR